MSNADSVGSLHDQGLRDGCDCSDRRSDLHVTMPARAGQTGTPVIIPGTALARAIRDPARLPRQPRTRVAPLDRLVATDVGRLLAASGTDGITDANVVIGARRSGAGVVTGDADDLHSLDPNLARTVI